MIGRNIFAIAGKEIRSNFVTPVAYVVASAFLVISSFFFFTLLQQFNSVINAAGINKEINPNLMDWVVTPFYTSALLVLVFIIPIVTMRTVAEEKNQGTFELLITAPLKVSDIVYGKFLGISFVMFVVLALMSTLPLTLILFSTLEVYAAIIGIFGLFIFSLAFSSLGIAISAMTKNQIVAGVISLVTFLILFIINAPAKKLGYPMQEILDYLSPSKHLEQLVRGVISSVDVVYFLSLIVIGLFVACRILEVRRWR